MKQTWKLSICLVLMAVTQYVWGDIYTVGRIDSPNTGNEILEIWDSGDVTDGTSTAFNTRTTAVDIGSGKGATWHYPHVAIGVGDINQSNSGKELILVGEDGLGIVSRLDASGSRIGGALYFRASADSQSWHVENTGALMVTAADINSSNDGNEVITLAGDGAMEVWQYNQSTGTIESRLSITLWAAICKGTISQAAIGEFDSANPGLELALLRTDNYVEIWDADYSDTDRLAVWNIGDSYSIFFAGNLDSSHVGDELVTIASDGTLEVWNPLGTSGSAESLGTGTAESTHSPFRTVAADLVPEPTTMMVIGLGGGILLYRRRCR